MKRVMTRIAVSSTIASLLLFASLSRGKRSDIVAKAHANTGCSVASVKGSYGFYRTGTTPFGPLAAVGIATYDGNGSSSVRQTTRRNGVTISHLFTTPAGPGTYEVDSDCSARGLNPDGSVFVHFVVVDGGNELLIVSLSDANTVHGVMKKKSIVTIKRSVRQQEPSRASSRSRHTLAVQTDGLSLPARSGSPDRRPLAWRSAARREQPGARC